ncbi:hypothetical protein CLAIMM_04960 [Cladophialophora immunda]|nr:hypothetical protein CLAIMM_04960 [Cladophialophora immunda]
MTMVKVKQVFLSLTIVDLPLQAFGAWRAAERTTAIYWWSCGRGVAPAGGRRTMSEIEENCRWCGAKHGEKSVRLNAWRPTLEASFKCVDCRVRVVLLLWPLVSSSMAVPV